MTPEPTPVSGMTPLLPSLVVPVTVIRTTAGLTFEATAIVADCSSIETGWRAPTLVPWATAADVGAAGRSRAPAALNARTVPPDASTADRSAAASRELPPVLLRGGTGTALAGTGVAAGSYHRSGVTGGVWSQDRAQSLRGSGLGANRSSAGSEDAVLPVEGAQGSTEAPPGVVGVADGQVGPVEAG